MLSSAIARADEHYALTVPVVDPPAMHGAIDASWTNAARVKVDYDFTYQRAATDPTSVYVAQDATGLDFAFVATQRENLVAMTQTNGAGVTSDDNVTVSLYPQGTQGFAYSFSANARGARYQTSSENASYAPEWTAVAQRTANGYVVTMHVPFAILRNGGAATWRVQFSRVVVATNSTLVWEHASNQRYASDATYAGTMSGLTVRGGANARPKPRVQLYGLGEMTPKANGGSTSRAGLDVAVPVTATSSFVATFHPDYSNLEIDQQTIAPTAYARQYAEVRPFFTQSTSNFNVHFACMNCPMLLYTPSIPEFGQGYAYEGTQGPLSFDAFDAIGTNRSDAGQALTYTITNPHVAYQVSTQRASVDTPLLHDDATMITSGFMNHHAHDFVYFNGGEDRGSNVTQSGLGDYFEYGGGYASQTTTAILSFQKVGGAFNPVDGYTIQPDLAGYIVLYNHTFNFSAKDVLHDVTWTSSYGRYGNHVGALAQTDASDQIALDFRNLMTFHVNESSQGVRGLTGEFLPYNTNQLYLGYKTATTTPTYVQYTSGPFYHGRLNAWNYLTSQPLMRGLAMTLELDEDQYGAGLPIEPTATQWLERASVDWQFNRNASFDIGARRIIGRNLPNSVQIPDLPTALAPYGTINGALPFDYVNAANVSLAFHFLAAHNEFYAVYGDPNSIATTPAFFLKWIRYIGAEKGT